MNMFQSANTCREVHSIERTLVRVQNDILVLVLHHDHHSIPGLDKAFHIQLKIAKKVIFYTTLA